MNENITYKVLWIEDNTSIVEGDRLIAANYNLNLVHFTNWTQAKVELDNNFEDYSAIILDANCKIDRDQPEREDFLITVLSQMQTLFGGRRQDIPWYILSAGTMKNFEFIVKGVLYSRKDKEKEWGTMLYMKDALSESENSIDKLFENIKRVAAKKSLNIVLHLHEKMFKYLGEGKLYGVEARKLMLDMLSALYCPQENLNFKYESTSIRKVLEYMFRAARRYGLLADECIDDRDRVNLSESSLYMAGKNTQYVGVRFGEPGSNENGRGGDAIFTREIEQIVQSLLNFSSSHAHTRGKGKNKFEYREKICVIDEGNKELYFGHLLHLCHVIKWFGEYVDKHPNIEENRKMKQLVPTSSDISADRQTNSINQKKEKKESFSLRVSREDVLGKEYIVLSGETGKYVGSCKLSPELNAQTNVSDKVRIVNVVDNDGSDKAKYPFIVTKIEKL